MSFFLTFAGVFQQLQTKWIFLFALYNLTQQLNQIFHIMQQSRLLELKGNLLFITFFLFLF